MSKKIAVTTSSFAREDRAPMEMLRAGGFRIKLNSLGRKLTVEETVNLCKGCVGIIAGTESYGRGALVRLSGLEVISRCGAGIESIDLDAAKELGIRVLNTPFGPTTAVAELTVALMLDLLRNISAMDREIRSRKWNKQMGNLLSGKRVGIIGFGRIGQKVSKLLKPFGCKILYNDPAVKSVFPGIERAKLGELLKSSEVVSIHVSSNDEILGEKELRRMKKGALLVNIARGKVINEDALYRALKDGHLGGAAIDVFKTEPYRGPLRKLTNVVLTPHIGSYAAECRIGMEIEAVKNLIKSLKGAI